MSSDRAEIDAIALQKQKARELYLSVKDSDEHGVHDLIAAGFDVNVNVNAEVGEYKTILQMAIELQNDAIARLLIDAGASLPKYNYQEKREKRSLRLAVKSTALCRTAVALLIIAAETEVRT